MKLLTSDNFSNVTRAPGCTTLHGILKEFSLGYSKRFACRLGTNTDLVESGSSEKLGEGRRYVSITFWRTNIIPGTNRCNEFCDTGSFSDPEHV